ncbi:hypothetical protein BSL78_03150, partial [Apostichopus japonicus]
CTMPNMCPHQSSQTTCTEKCFESTIFRREAHSGSSTVWPVFITTLPRLPGVLIGYVKITKETLSNPQYEILNENGESVLLVRPVSGSKYNVFSQGGNYRIGEFCPRMTSGIKGSFPRDLDVRMKAGVLLTAVVICRKRAKERRS